jgi:hypothetical protein
MTLTRPRRGYELQPPEKPTAERETTRHDLSGRLLGKYRKRIKEATFSTDSLWKLARWARDKRPYCMLIPPLQRPEGQMETDAANKRSFLGQSSSRHLWMLSWKTSETTCTRRRYKSPPITLDEVLLAVRKTGEKPLRQGCHYQPPTA